MSARSCRKCKQHNIHPTDFRRPVKRHRCTRTETRSCLCDCLTTCNHCDYLGSLPSTSKNATPANALDPLDVLVSHILADYTTQEADEPVPSSSALGELLSNHAPDDNTCYYCFFPFTFEHTADIMTNFDRLSVAPFDHQGSLVLCDRFCARLRSVYDHFSLLELNAIVWCNQSTHHPQVPFDPRKMQVHRPANQHFPPDFDILALATEQQFRSPRHIWNRPFCICEQDACPLAPVLVRTLDPLKKRFGPAIITYYEFLILFDPTTNTIWPASLFAIWHSERKQCIETRVFSTTAKLWDPNTHVYPFQ